jgi:hypothetical protein
MRLANQTISVVPNPYTYLDEDGDPCGLVAVDSELQPYPGYVGASTKSVTTLDNYDRGYFLSPRRHVKFEYTLEPVTLQLSNYYKDLVKGGELLAADEATAKLCGIPYVPFRKALKLAADKAAKDCFAAYGLYPEWYTPEPEVAKEPKPSK